MTTQQITCDDCEATTIPCNCCEWCEMFPCECVDDDECEFDIAGTTGPIKCD